MDWRKRRVFPLLKILICQHNGRIGLIYHVSGTISWEVVILKNVTVKLSRRQVKVKGREWYVNDTPGEELARPQPAQAWMTSRGFEL